MLSFILLIKLIPEIKNRSPSAPKIIIDIALMLEPFVVVQTTATYIRPPIPRIVNNAPKIRFKFIVFFLINSQKSIWFNTIFYKRLYQKSLLNFSNCF